MQMRFRVKGLGILVLLHTYVALDGVIELFLEALPALASQMW